ncbi:MAG: hypothetical protein ACYDBQ_09205 [Thermoplasmatota archaeon]
MSALHDECLTLAHALDGVAGALHEGRAVAPDDLQAMGRCGAQLWEAGETPDPFHNQDFRDARTEFEASALPAAAGLPKAGTVLERSAHRMALDLRWMAHVCAGRAARPLPESLDRDVLRLAGRYARFAGHVAPG